MSNQYSVRWMDLQTQEAQDTWDSLPVASGWDTVFGESSFLSAISSAAGLGVLQVVVSDADGPVAAARLAVRSRFGLKTVIVPPFASYSGIRLRSEPKEAEINDRSSSLETLLDAIESEFPATALHLPPAVQDVRVFSWRGWTVRPLYTYRMHLDAATDPSAAWSESARRLARHHAENYEIVASSPQIQAELQAGSYRRSNRALPIGEAGLVSILTNLLAKGTVTAWSALNRESGEHEASVTILRRRHIAHYWMAGSRPGPSMTVLLATVLPQLAADNVTIFDFVGANTASIAEFKRRFGGQLTAYYRASWRSGLIGQFLGHE